MKDGTTATEPPAAAELWMCEQVERAAGLPVGSIIEKILGRIILG